MAAEFAGYLDRLSKSLVGLKSETSAEVIFAEAKDHLEQSVDELVAQGMSREAAEDEAMTRFGSTDAVLEWYAGVHRCPNVWRASVWPLAVLFAFFFTRFSGLEKYLYLIPHVPWVIGQFIPLMFVDLALLATIIACYRSKRFTSGVIFLAVAGFLVVGTLVLSLVSVKVPGERGYYFATRSTASDSFRNAPTALADARSKLSILQAGEKLFASKTPPDNLPATYRTSKGYAIPDYFLNMGTLGRTFVDGEQVDGIFESYGMARQFWEGQPSNPGEHVPFYISDIQQRVENQEKILAEQPALLAKPRLANVGFFASNLAQDGSFILGFGIIADVSGGVLRLLVTSLRRRKRQNLATG